MSNNFDPKNSELAQLSKTGALGGVSLSEKFETKDMITFSQKGGPDVSYPKWYLALVQSRRSKE